ALSLWARGGAGAARRAVRGLLRWRAAGGGRGAGGARRAGGDRTRARAGRRDDRGSDASAASAPGRSLFGGRAPGRPPLLPRLWLPRRRRRRTGCTGAEILGTVLHGGRAARLGRAAIRPVALSGSRRALPRAHPRRMGRAPRDRGLLRRAGAACRGAGGASSAPRALAVAPRRATALAAGGGRDGAAARGSRSGAGRAHGRGAARGRSFRRGDLRAPRGGSGALSGRAIFQRTPYHLHTLSPERAED